MTSGSDVRRLLSSSNRNIETTFTGLRPSTEYNISVAVNMTYGIGHAVSVAAATTSEFLQPPPALLRKEVKLIIIGSDRQFVNRITKNL